MRSARLTPRTDRLGFRFISEKVSHHPPVIAFLGDAPERGWQICGYTSPSTKFWGRSMEVRRSSLSRSLPRHARTS